MAAAAGESEMSQYLCSGVLVVYVSFYFKLEIDAVNQFYFPLYFLVKYKKGSVYTMTLLHTITKVQTCISLLHFPWVLNHPFAAVGNSKVGLPLNH